MWIWCPGGVLFYLIRHVMDEELSQTKHARNVQLLHMMTYPSNILCKCISLSPQKSRRRKDEEQEEEGRGRLRREGRGERRWPFREAQSCGVSSKLLLLRTQEPFSILSHSRLLVVPFPLSPSKRWAHCVHCVWHQQYLTSFQSNRCFSKLPVLLGL